MSEHRCRPAKALETEGPVSATSPASEHPQELLHPLSLHAELCRRGQGVSTQRHWAGISGAAQCLTATGCSTGLMSSPSLLPLPPGPLPLSTFRPI